MMPMAKKNNKILEEILKLAISREIEAFRFYRALANMFKEEDKIELTLELAEKEREHKAKLEGLLGKGVEDIAVEREYLKMASALSKEGGMETIQIDRGSKIKDILSAAMNKEEWSYDLYHGLGCACLSEGERLLFDLLASEEREHIEVLSSLYRYYSGP